MVAVALLLAGATFSDVRIHIRAGHFTISRVHVGSGQSLLLSNEDDETYTVESPGAFVGDVMLLPHAQTRVKMRRGGNYVAMVEEHPDSEVELDVDYDPNAPKPTESPFDLAKARGLQSLDLEGEEPAYGALTQFDLAVKGEAGRQKVLKELYQFEEELSEDLPPPELALYFSGADWMQLRGSVSMVYGLGPSAYDPSRFGPAVGASRPDGLHQVPALASLGITGPDTGQRDVIVRVESDSAWFNLRACRLIWSRLGSEIGNRKLEWGYAGPNGRSPILGGFYDGTGNPSGPARSQAVFNRDGTSMIAVYKIRFDEARFAKISRAEEESIIGREKNSGKPIRRPADVAHKMRASDGHSAIVRMPLIFDEGIRGTGLLFISAQRSFDPLEKLLDRMKSVQIGAHDRLMSFMQFDSAAYYAIPPSPQGGYPGSLRKSAFTFGL